MTVADTIAGIQPANQEAFSGHPPERKTEDVRSEERIRVKFADQEM